MSDLIPIHAIVDGMFCSTSCPFLEEYSEDKCLLFGDLAKEVRDGKDAYTTRHDRCIYLEDLSNE